MIIEEALSHTIAYLSQKGIQGPRRAAEEMLCDVLSLKRMDLYLDFDRPLNQEELGKCRKILVRLAAGEPIQYVLGSVLFYQCEFDVNEAVLIPRPETELLVDKIVRELKLAPLADKKLWDLCCGSGCIGISLKKALPDLNVTLSDVSADALAVARKNAEKNEAAISFLEGDLFFPFQGKADWIVANPPYVSEEEYHSLDPSVKDFEPSLALSGGKDGCDFFRAIAQDLKKYLNPGGKLWLEIGYQQGAKVNEIFENEGISGGIIEKDWSGHDRFFAVNL